MPIIRPKTNNMPIPWLPAAISGAAGLIGTIVRNRREKKKAATERQWAQEDWDKVNAYNAPKAQMERFKDANLNPNLMYSQGSSGNAESIGQTEAASPDGGIEQMAGTTINSYYDFQRHKAGMDKIEEDTRLQKHNADRAEQENQMLFQKWLEEQKYIPENVKADWARKQAETLKTNIEANRMQSYEDHFNKRFKGKSSGGWQAAQDLQTIPKQIEKLKSEINLLGSQTATEQQRSAVRKKLSEAIEKMPKSPIRDWLEIVLLNSINN